MSVMSKERNLKEWLRDFVAAAKETVTDTYCSIQPLSRWVAGIWYIVYIGTWVRWLQPFTLLGSAWSLAVAIGNLPCVCVKHLKRCKTSNLHLTRHVFCLRFLTSFGFQPEFQQRFQFEFQQRQGSAAWLWDRTERSYHNHGILVWSTQRTCHFCLSNFC